MKISGKFILKVAGTLTVISLVVALLLGLVNGVTKDKIAAIEAEKTRVAMSAVVPEGSEFTDALEIPQAAIDAAKGFGHQHRLDRSAAEAAIGLGKGQAQDAELGILRPQVARPAIGGLHVFLAVLEAVLRGQQLAQAVLQQPLVFGEIEIHFQQS